MSGKPIPERWQEVRETTPLETVRILIDELAAAENDAAHCHDEHSVGLSKLLDQLVPALDRAETAEAKVRELEQERAELLAAWKNQIIALQAQLQAVIQERDRLLAPGDIAQHAMNCAGFDRMRDCTCGLPWRIQLAQLQARNSQLEKALERHGEHRVTCTYEYGRCDCGLEAALSPATKEPAGRSCKDCGTLIPPAEGCNGHCWACHRDYEQTLELQRKASEP